MKDLILILILSVSWLFIFYFLKYSRIFIAYLLIGFPYFFKSRLWYHIKKISKMMDRINGSNTFENSIEVTKVVSINEKIDSLEKNSEKVYRNKKSNLIWILFFSNKFLNSFINSQIEGPYQLLDLERNLLKLNSTDHNELLSATMNIKYNESLTVNEKEKIMKIISSNYSTNKELMEIVNYDY